MVELLTILTLALVAFAGGALGAAIGGYPAFSLAGVVIVVGEIAKMLRGPVDLTTLGSTGLDSMALTASVGLGTGFGPHVVLGGGVAAAAYAARHGYMDTGFDYHEAKHVTHALGTKPDVLFVGGVFGVVGFVLTQGAVSVGIPTDPIALSIVVSAFLHRIAFGYPLLGEVRGGFLDMTPFERGERRVARADGGAEGDDETSPQTRLVVEPWLPHQYRWANVTLLGFAVGVFAAFVTYQTGSPFLAFGLTAASLVFVAFGKEKFPVTHHMALPASIVVVALVGFVDPALLEAGVTPAEMETAVTLHLAVGAGGLLGALSGVFGELSQRLLYAHADTHLDPPAAAIVLSVLLIGLVELAGVWTTGVIPMP